MTNDAVTDLSRVFAENNTSTGTNSPVSMADFDGEAYRPYLDGLDLTDAQADALMRIVWDIMRLFVEMDLPVDSCGQIVQSIIDPTSAESDSLE